MPSGERKTVLAECRAMIGVVAGGGRIDKPILKEGVQWHKFKAKRHIFSRVRPVAMNPVDHRFWFDNHQHLGRPATVSRKVGKVAARRAGLVRGGKGEKKIEKKA